MGAKHAYSTASARIDGDVKKEAVRVLKELGLTPAMAFRMMMRRIAAENAMPFDLFVPNAETIEAIEAGRRGEVTTCNTVEELLNLLILTARAVFVKVKP
jgi:DNA-damage-inducible protein J